MALQNRETWGTHFRADEVSKDNHRPFDFAQDDKVCSGSWLILLIQSAVRSSGPRA
jgi:hypothetical protein